MTFAELESTLKGGVEGAIALLRGAGYVIVSPDEMPTIGTKMNGGPKLPPLPLEPDDPAHGGRAGFFRLQAVQSLALADWWEKKAERDRKLRAELEEFLSQIGIDFSDMVAEQLIAAGWRRS